MNIAIVGATGNVGRKTCDNSLGSFQPMHLRQYILRIFWFILQYDNKEIHKKHLLAPSKNNEQ